MTNPNVSGLDHVPGKNDNVSLFVPTSLSSYSEIIFVQIKYTSLVSSHGGSPTKQEQTKRKASQRPAFKPPKVSENAGRRIVDRSHIIGL